MAQPTRFAAQAATPARIGSGRVVELQTIFAHNPSESAGAYVKIYASAGTTAPDGSAVPIFSAWVAAGAAASGGHAEVIPVFIDGANLWIAVATEAGAGLTAPASAFQITITTTTPPAS